MGEHESKEEFAIEAIDRFGTFDQGLQPDRDVPQPRVLEEQSGGYRHVGMPGIEREHRWIEIEICRAGEAGGLLPIIYSWPDGTKTSLPL